MKQSFQDLPCDCIVCFILLHYSQSKYSTNTALYPFFMAKHYCTDIYELNVAVATYFFSSLLLLRSL